MLQIGKSFIQMKVPGSEEGDSEWVGWREEKTEWQNMVDWKVLRCVEIIWWHLLMRTTAFWIEYGYFSMDGDKDNYE